MINYLTYPIHYMNITQDYSESYSHSPHSQGTPADYPIDDACSDSGRDWFYCPCDEMRVVHIYGVGKSGTNTIWLESTSPVVMPCGEDYVTIQVIHPNDDTLSDIRKGQTFKRGDKMFLEGNDGNATGYHFHIAVGTGKFTGSGWTQNTKGAWVNQTTGRQLKPEEAFWIDKTFTTIKNAHGITFKNLPAEQQTEPVEMEVSDTQTNVQKTRDDILYRVQIGAYRNIANADALAAKAKAKGFDAVVIPFVKGDVDGDGKVTSADARLALRISTGVE